MFSFALKNSSLYDVLHNNEKVVFTSEVICDSDIFEHDKKKYIRVRVGDVTLQFLNSLNCSCSNFFSKFIPIINNRSLVVKLPYRYKRYQISYSGLASSDDFFTDNKIRATIEVAGVVIQPYSAFCSFKLTALEQVN